MHTMWTINRIVRTSCGAAGRLSCCVAGVAVLLAGCGGGGTSPGRTVMNYLDAHIQGESGEAAALACMTEEARAGMREAKKIQKALQAKQGTYAGFLFSRIVRYELGATSIEKGIASVRATARVEKKAGDDTVEETANMCFLLKPEGGVWKILSVDSGEEPVSIEGAPATDPGLEAAPGILPRVSGAADDAHPGPPLDSVKKALESLKQVVEQEAASETLAPQELKKTLLELQKKPSPVSGGGAK